MADLPSADRLFAASVHGFESYTLYPFEKEGNALVALDVKGARATQQMALEMARKNSPNFNGILKREIERRDAEIVKTGEWEWCAAKRRDYEAQKGGGDIFSATPPKPKPVDD